MNDPVIAALDFVQGPVFRFCFALMVFGLLRRGLLAVSDLLAARVSATDPADFRWKVRQRLLWFFLPALVAHRLRPEFGRGAFYFDLALGCVSIAFRGVAVALPALMAAHVYLWERWLGFSWPTIPHATASGLAVAAVVCGFVLFLGGIYSPMLRAYDPWWAHVKPLVLITPFAAGYLAMHPAWSPFDYHVVRLIHVGSACLVFVLLPFARMLAPVHTPLAQAVPAARWVESAGASGDPRSAFVADRRRHVGVAADR